MARTWLISPYTPRHEFPPALRRRHTLEHVAEVGFADLARHPLPHTRGNPKLPFIVPAAVFIGLGLIGGIAMAANGQPFWILPLCGLGAWLAIIALPFLLPQYLLRERRRARVERAAEALPTHRGAPGTVPGQLGKEPGVVAFADGWIRVIAPHGQLAALPFGEIQVAEELLGKGLWGFPGVDIMNRAGEWTEIRTMDNRELLDALERSGVPVLRTAKGIR
ncbi:hypothetical protein [Streptomyces radicis]|uniref:Uncharacterized protein n=1 Tax=Streptomyces radicis TaxID=1750517 RepID=A0A3A9WGP3_9ACTN|nr:hypothetical protein [Streptomyces radicis]RKN11969.1 hypothetical protein D7319_03420 [Streptomyces radicis]RKN25979.1 hypothetical protein D7318_07060 [Streptomyces radicis]